jgi:hypothetical protein
MAAAKSCFTNASSPCTRGTHMRRQRGTTSLTDVLTLA